MKNENEESCFEYSDELKKIVDDRYLEYKTNQIVLISAEESREMICKLLSEYIKP